jgi:hypothetical protein
MMLNGEAGDNGWSAPSVTSGHIDPAPPTICAKAPLEYAVEMFGKMAKVLGVVIRKRLVNYLDVLEHKQRRLRDESALEAGHI